MPLTVEEQHTLLNQATALHTSLRQKALTHSSNAKIQSGQFNIATLTVFDTAGTEQYFEAAFSNYSSLTKFLKADYVPSVPRDFLDSVGVAAGTICGNHTEPKLFYDWRLKLQSGPPNTLLYAPRRLIMSSELDCCTSCLNWTVRAITAIAGMLALSGVDLDFIVVETNSGRVRMGENT